jgi:hypothetical protein
METWPRRRTTSIFDSLPPRHDATPYAAPGPDCRTVRLTVTKSRLRVVKDRVFVMIAGLGFAGEWMRGGRCRQAGAL